MLQKLARENERASRAELPCAVGQAKYVVSGYPEKLFLCKAFEDSRPSSPKHQRLWLCFTRQQTKAKNPDYVGRPAKAGFGEKLKKAIQYVLFKELWTTSSIPPPAL